MSPFHSGMNHWQRQWLSDRLHKKHQSPQLTEITPPVADTKPKPVRTRKPKRDRPAGNENANA